MSSTYKLNIDLRFKKDTPHEVIDFLVNGHLYEGQIEFRWIHPEDSYEAKNIMLVKNQYQYTQNEIDEYRYELSARLYFKDDEMNLIFRFSSYLAQYTETNGFVGYYICADSPNNQPTLMYFNGKDVSVSDFAIHKTFATNWMNENDTNL
jgi:hypothetical protein